MAALRFTSAQIEGPVLAARRKLENDLLEHLIEFKPEVIRAYPPPYIRWLVRDTLDLAAPFQLRSVPALRVFLQLRFDIAPGFFKEAGIAGVLADRGLQPMERWARLSQPEYGDAWLRARTFSGADEWRARFWQAGS